MRRGAQVRRRGPEHRVRRRAREAGFVPGAERGAGLENRARPMFRAPRRPRRDELHATPDRKQERPSFVTRPIAQPHPGKLRRTLVEPHLDIDLADDAGREMLAVVEQDHGAPPRVLPDAERHGAREGVVQQRGDRRRRRLVLGGRTRGANQVADSLLVRGGQWVEPEHHHRDLGVVAARDQSFAGCPGRNRPASRRTRERAHRESFMSSRISKSAAPARARPRTWPKCATRIPRRSCWHMTCGATIQRPR